MTRLALCVLLAVASIAAVTLRANADERRDGPTRPGDGDRDHDRGRATATPIKHVIVIFNENISFDHYFGTYPMAQNNPGETTFIASPKTPKSINTLLTPLDTTNHFAALTSVDLLHSNPNSNPVAPLGPSATFSVTNGANAANPFRLAPSQAVTADQGHAPK